MRQLIAKLLSLSSEQKDVPDTSNGATPKVEKQEESVGAFSVADLRVGQGGKSDEVRPAYDTEERITAVDFLSGSQDEMVSPDLIHPDKEGLEVVGARELMTANKLLISQALEAFTNKTFIEDFDDQLVELIRRVAHWMGPYPASKAHHHTGRGGLFTHSLGVAVSALHLSSSKNVVMESSPRDRDAGILAWQLICFIGGLLHDIGKIHTIGKVKALAVGPDPANSGRFRSSAAPIYDHPWEPMVEGFEGWVQSNRVKSYYIDFDTDEPLEHRDFTTRYVQSLIPRPILAYIYAASPAIRQQFEDFIRNPQSGSRAPVFQVVQDADHVNVAQSIDPRRKPGVIEMTSLVMRRFTEFASDTTWNMPNSAFIYAHVQKETPDGLRFFGVPFFVASEASIQSFLNFMRERPMLGVSFGERFAELVFNCLETANVLSRTIEGLLPVQIVDETLQDYIPASRAELRFRAANVASVIKPVNGKHEDLLTTLSVVPVRCVIPAHVAFKAPTLAFSGTPSNSAATVVPAVIDKGTLEPSDPTLLNDPEYMKQFHALSAEELPPEQQAILPDIAPSKRSTKRHKTKTKVSDLQPDHPDHPDDQNDPVSPLRADTAVSPHTSSRSPQRITNDAYPDELPFGQKEPDEHPSSSRGQQPNTRPAWLTYYLTLCKDPDAVTQVTFWPVAYIYLSEHPDPSSFGIEPTDNGSGVYGFRGSIAVKLRNAFQKDIRSIGADFAPFSRFWPAEKLTPNSAHLQEALKPNAATHKSDPLSSASMVFKPRACEIIEDHLDPTPMESQA